MVLLRYFFAVFLLMSVLQAGRAYDEAGLKDISVYVSNSKVRLTFDKDDIHVTDYKDWIGIYEAHKSPIWENSGKLDDNRWTWVHRMSTTEENGKIYKFWDFDFSLKYGDEYKVAYFVDNSKTKYGNL